MLRTLSNSSVSFFVLPDISFIWSSELGITFVDSAPSNPLASSRNLQNIYFPFNLCVDSFHILSLTNVPVE